MPTPQERAQWKVAAAKLNRVLIPQPCEVCGSEIVDAHHDDYSKPLDVRWLCPLHHRRLHAGVPMGTERYVPRRPRMGRTFIAEARS